MSDPTSPKHRRKWNILGIILIVLVALVWSWNLRKPPGDTLPAQAFFTVDDGKNWFADDFTKVAPFERDGKQAYRCYVYTCDGGRTKFVGYLERYTPGGKDYVAAEMKRTGRFDPANAFMHLEVRRPGSADVGWVKINTPAGRVVTDVKCPRGSSKRPQIVSPD